MLGFTFKDGVTWIAGWLEGIAEDGNLPDFDKCVTDVAKLEPDVEAIIVEA